MSELSLNLINATASGNAVDTEAAFNAAMAEKVSAKLDDMRISVAQSMFKEKTVEETPAEISAEEPVEEPQAE